jgi:amidophosphoribosyltransferase
MKIHKDKFRDECGVFGIYNNNGLDIARTTYFGLYALQHRGQESCGMAVNMDGTLIYHKELGLVPDVFDDVRLNYLQGKMAIGHVRYSTTGGNNIINAQPMVVNYIRGQMALAHNGNLINASTIREELEQNGAIFQSTNDTELIASLISRIRISKVHIGEAIEEMMSIVKGSYSLVILTPKKLIGVRDSSGVRPLVIGMIDKSFVLASETCALDAIGAEFVRDVNPGEIVLIDENGLKSIQTKKKKNSCLCIFEFVYFARPDSILDGSSVYEARLSAGMLLAKEHPVDADIVIGAPTSGITAAIGYAKESGIEYGQGLLKNRYVGRTFIQPEQAMREQAVRIKFNPIKATIEGKRVVMIDDSIVRGTTTKKVIEMLRSAGAKEVHMRISSPPVKYPCYYGIDTPIRKHLIASKQDIEGIRKHIDADSLGYLSMEGLLSTPKNCSSGFCSACFDGNYPLGVSDSCEKD